MENQALRHSTRPAGPIIRASEIGLYVFCHRAWWYQVAQGLESANVRELVAGEDMHQRHGQQVRWSIRLQLLAYVLVTLAALVLALLVILWVSSR